MMMKEEVSAKMAQATFQITWKFLGFSQLHSRLS